MNRNVLSNFLRSIVKRGTLEVFYADGSIDAFGTFDEHFPDVAISFSDNQVPRDILIDPRLGAAEAFMDGRLNMERGGIMDLIYLLRANQPWDKGGELRGPKFGKRLLNRAAFGIEGLNDRIRSKSNVSHHYDIGNDL